jgi:enoyl-CoA hydratase/3-hydroxyacyl-CoA dehydrogenase
MDINELKTITVIGAGVMGSGIAQTALMSGYTVHLTDSSKESLDRAVDSIYKSLEKLASKAVIAPDLITRIKDGKLILDDSVANSVRNADFVIEAVPEDMSIKKTVFKIIDANVTEKTIIASNTSTMSITSFALFTSHPGNVLGMHFFNPPVLMKLVEVIASEYTTKETLQFGCDFINKIGKVLIVARKDTPGFIANRIAAPVVVYNGLRIDVDGLDPADIDISMMKIGQKMGPMELADFSGIDVMNNVQRYYHEYLSSDYNPSQTALQLEKDNKLGRKTGSGYYVWVDGKRPALDETKYTGEYDPEIPFLIQANEASKLVEQRICSPDDCNMAMIYGYNSTGPIDFIQNLAPEYIEQKLLNLATKYKKAIFRPTAYLKDGKYLVSK